MGYLFITAVALILSLGLTPVMMAVSRRWKLLDMPNARKEHTQPIPLMGGIAIYIATIITTAIYVLFYVHSLQLNIIVAFFIGISGVTMMGLIDDILSLSAKRRLIILFVLAMIVLMGTLQFYFPQTLLQEDIWRAIFISLFVVIWIVAITNAINFSDGLDGLASSLSLVSAIGFAVLFFIQGRTQLALPTTLALCGAIIGFLPFNISPAKIFMGDAGSMFIGFMLGILTIMCVSEQPIGAFVVPVFLILVPIADMCMSVLRRFLLKTPLMKPDKMHFHHMMNRRFKNHRVVVLVLTTAQLMSAGVGIFIYTSKLYTLGWILLGILALAAILYTIFRVRAIKRALAAGYEI